MTEYYVTWDISIEADSPQEAAELARKIQLDPSNIATHFHVISMAADCEEIAECVELPPPLRSFTCH